MRLLLDLKFSNENSAQPLATSKVFGCRLVIARLNTYIQWIDIGRTTAPLRSVADGPHVSDSLQIDELGTWPLCFDRGRRSAFSQQETAPMRLFMFKSQSNRELRAFAADPGGKPLPSRHGPWTAVAVLREDKQPPHKISRKVVEQSIADQGFQLYKVKSAAAG
jgi:hypothetical protein